MARGGYGGAERSLKIAEAFPGHDVKVVMVSSELTNKTVRVRSGLEFIYVAEDRNTHAAISQTASRMYSGNHDVALYATHTRLAKTKAVIKKFVNDGLDTVIVDHYGSAGLIKDVAIDVPIIYSSHNCETFLADQMYPQNHKIRDMVKTIEKEILERSSAMIYCSKEDKTKIEGIYGYSKPSFYVPNGADEQKDLVLKNNYQAKDIIFIGSGHGPNVDAAKSLIQVALSMPEYRFNIIGNCGGGIDKNSVPSNYIVHGFLSDQLMNLLFENSFAFINPIMSGSGTHLKVMRSLSYGLPVISSTIGLRGFTEEEIKDTMFVASTAEEMQQAIKSLKNKDIYESVQKKTLKLASNYYWEKIQAECREQVEDFLGNKYVEAQKETLNKEKVMIYSIVRNNGRTMDRYYQQVKAVVQSLPEYDFYLSIYENDSTDDTKLKLFSKDWTFLSGISIISENINTEHYGSVKDAGRVENLAKARNRAIEAAGFMDICDYILMVEGDNVWGPADVGRLLNFKTKEPNFDIVSGISLRENSTHYDAWATRTTPIFREGVSEIPKNFRTLDYGKFYSTSNGLCLYRTEAFRKGARHGWINEANGKPDCEMVVLCQQFHKLGHGNIFIDYNAISRH